MQNFTSAYGRSTYLSQAATCDRNPYFYFISYLIACLSTLFDVAALGLPTYQKARYTIAVFYSFIRLYSFAIMNKTCPAIRQRTAIEALSGLYVKVK